MRSICVVSVMLLGAGWTWADCGARQFVVQQQVVPVQAVAVTPLAFTIPHYSVGYSAAGDQSETLRELIAELRQLRQALTANQLVGPPKVESVEARALNILNTRCAGCHHQDVAEQKGGKRVYLTGHPAKLVEGLDRFRMWDATYTGRMPPTPHQQIPQQEKDDLLAWVREANKVKASK